jgi:hypothetical protein
MTLTGYRLAGTAKTAPPDYIPSLIGIDPQQVGPAATDTYFEQISLPATAINLNTAALTRWVSYDSLPLDHRDPIVAVKGVGADFYIPLSELVEMTEQYGTPSGKLIVDGLLKLVR